MGDFTLGCLLGQYDNAQSFDVASTAYPANVQSWQRLSAAQNSLEYWSANQMGILATHSSNQGVRFVVSSSAIPLDAALRYAYSTVDDAYARWFPAVATHDIRVDAWARFDTATASGSAVLQLDDSGLAIIPYTAADSMAHLRAATVTYSGKNVLAPHLDIDINSRYGGVYALYLDSVLTQIDPIVLHPEYGLREQALVMQSRHRTRAGDAYAYRWGRYSAFQVPLRFLADSHADLINWWWEGGFYLAFTLDTSDSESIRVVRIANERQPIESRVAPYEDLWQGTLELESIHAGGLAF